MEIQYASITELANYLKTKLPPEFQILEDFPSPNQPLSYPTLSLTPATMQIKLKPPQFMKFEDKVGTVATIESFYVVADINLPIQLDLWFMSNDQRKYYMGFVTNSLIQNPARSGDINLKLTDHYDVHANYQIDDSVKFSSTSDETLVSEYRAKYDILCTTELVATKEEYKMLHLTLHSKVYVNNPELLDDYLQTIF